MYDLDFQLDCTEVEDCADIGREECSLDTPEQTCGACLQGHVGEEGDGNEECIRTFGTTKSVILCILSLRYYYYSFHSLLGSSSLCSSE